MGGRPLAKVTRWAQFSVTMLFAGVVTVLLVLGVRDANRLEAASSALQLATQLSERPELLAAQLTLIQRGLEATTYVGRSLHTLTDLRQSTSEALAKLSTALLQARLLADARVTDSLNTTVLRWRSLDEGLSSIPDQHGGMLYIDASTDSELSASGKAMKAAVDGMLADTQNLQQMSSSMSRLASILRAAVDDSDWRLRALLMGGSALAGLMLGLALYYAWRSRLARRAAAQAERQVSNILSTVREGLFLIDRQLRLSPTYSDSLPELLHRPAPAGLLMEQLLEPLVDAKTLNAALKYLGLLWKDKLHEELIESVNPLSEIEVSFAQPPRRHREAASDVLLSARAFCRDRGQLHSRSHHRYHRTGAARPRARARASRGRCAIDPAITAAACRSGSATDISLVDRPRAPQEQCGAESPRHRAGRSKEEGQRRVSRAAHRQG